MFTAPAELYDAIYFSFKDYAAEAAAIAQRIRAEHPTAVICMFSSIGYVRTLPALERTLRCFANHVARDGVVIVEPWFPPEKPTSGYHSERLAEAGGVRVHRKGTTVIEDRMCLLRFKYTVERGSDVTFEPPFETARASLLYLKSVHS
ncbi:MAG: hypothetical protein ACT4P6_12570 [Gemmatimonadaceae bacterium]